MADVYLAVSRTSSGLEKLSVLKRLRPEVADDPEELAHFKGMFWDEAKLAMLLNHANVVHTHDACEEGSSLYIVMEYIEGQALNAVQRELARRSEFLSPVHACLVISEILAGLNYAHELRDLSGDHLNLVHRDVSPQNILLGYDGSVKLVDFGVAKASTRSTETRAGTLKGKARYMAPEQVLNKGVDRRADVYAAGVVLWELIARRKLVAGSNMVEELVNVIKNEPDRLSSVVPDVDPELDAIVHTAIAREPAHRYQTALAFREALLSYVARSKGDARVAELGLLVSRVFAGKRDEVSRTIRERLAIDVAREASGIDPVSAPNLFFEDDRSDRSLPSIHSGGKTGLSQVSFTPHAVVQTSHAIPPPSGSKKTVPLLVGSLMALLLLVGGLAGVLVSGSRAHRDASATSPPPPPVVVLPEPKAEKPPAPVQPPPAIETKPAAEIRPAAEAPKAFVRAPEPARASVPRWTPSPTVAPAPPPQPAATAQEESQGFLTIDTYPWTKVSENGRVLGNTPLVRVPLAAGTHVLTLENPADGVKQTTTVVVKSGETISKRLAF